MPLLIEFLLPRRPLSQQSGSARHRREWKDFVFGRAFTAWHHPPIVDRPLKLTIVYLCEQIPIDINNVVKPIEDAMTGLVFADDRLVVDVSAHLRYLSEPIKTVGLPVLLAKAVKDANECIYVRVSPAGELNLEINDGRTSS